MDKLVLYDELRVDYKIDPSFYPDQSLDRLVTRACNKVSEYYPDKGRNFVLTVAEQTRYKISDSDLLKLREVFYIQGYSPTALFGDPDIIQNMMQIPRSQNYSPSRQLVIWMEQETFRKFNPSGAEIISHDTFDLIPTPIKDEVPVFYIYDKFRYIESIPLLLREEIVKLIFYYMNETDALKTMHDSKNIRYTFDRKGNTMTDKDTATDMLIRRQKILDEIVKDIRRKVMSL